MSQTKPMQDCHPERSEGSLSGEGSFAALRMTKRDGLVFEMYWAQRYHHLKGEQLQCVWVRELNKDEAGFVK